MYAVLAGIVALLFLLLGAVQIGSDAIFSSAAAPGSLPARLPHALGVTIYTAIERIAPAPYVESMLARAAYDRGDLQAAQAHARRLPPSGQRDELLAQIAQARGDETLAERYFIGAADVFSIATLVDRLASNDPAKAYALELRMKQRLEQTATHPDALAEVDWRLGQLATLRAGRAPAQRNVWLRQGMRDYERALALAPLSGKYLMAAGVQSLELRDDAAAQRYFRRAIDVNPANGDAYAGLGLAALAQGRRDEARADAEKSRIYDPHSGLLEDLDAALR